MCKASLGWRDFRSCHCRPFLYRPLDDPVLPFQVHGGYMMFCALLSPGYCWASWLEKFFSLLEAGDHERVAPSFLLSFAGTAA